MNTSKKRRHIPEAARRRKLRHRYGLEVEDYRRMFEMQEYCCASCGEEKHYDLYVDHNHETGEVRGLLCAKCNTIAGSIEHRNYNQVLAYLRRYESGTD